MKHGTDVKKTALVVDKQSDGHITPRSGACPETALSFDAPGNASRADLAWERHLPELGLRGKILVMDDDETMQEILGEMLPSMGYVSAHALDGTEAMEMYRLAMEAGEPFDLVIMDLTVSRGMGGLEAVQKLLRMDHGAKVIVSSGYADDPAMLDFRKYGFKGGLDKPFKINDLQNLLKTLISED